MQFRTQHFEDAYEHARSVPEWTRVYSQMSPGSLRSTLSQFKAAEFQLFRESINQRLVRQGEAPRGRVCFAVTLVVPGAVRLQVGRVRSSCSTCPSRIPHLQPV